MSIQTIVGVRNSTRRARAVLTLAAVAWALAACGQKGPLFLPPPPATAQPAKAAPANDSRNNRPAETPTPPAR